jgi:hypothetical protein
LRAIRSRAISASDSGAGLPPFGRRVIEAGDTPMSDDTAPIYSERYVAFIDILGFSHIVRESVNHPWQAEQLVAILEGISGRATPLESDKLFGDDFRAQSFSDCIVLSERATNIGLEHLLFAVSQLALDLLASGILTRGAIAKGRLHHTAKIVFGPALVEAYRIESAIAVFPRILIDRDAHRDFKSMVEVGRKTFIASGFEAEIRHDDDGPPFLDILSPFRDLSGSTPERLLVTAETCHRSIQTKLDDSIYDPSIYKKLRWLTVYWNGVAMSAGSMGMLKVVDFPQLSDRR